MRKKAKTISILTSIVCVICICLIAACGSGTEPNPTAFDCTTCPVHSTCDSVNRICNCDSGYVAFSDTANGIYFACQDVNTFNCSTCPVHSTCDLINQVCNCDTGYQYVSSNNTCIAMREKFLGSYNGTSSCLPAVSSVPVAITAETTDPQQITITGLVISSGTIGPVFARADTASFTIIVQTEPSGHSVWGNGTLIGADSIDIQYSVQGGTGTINCEYTGRK